MNFDRLIAAFKAFLSSFDYEPPPAMAKTEPASTQVMPRVDTATFAEHDAATQARLDEIAKAGPNDLPQIVTRQVTDWSTGAVTIVHQDGRPLTVIERAILDRQAELRRQAGG